MGADACLHVLDDRTLHGRLMPSFRRLLLDGSIDGSIDGRLDAIALRDQLDLPGAGRADLAGHCTLLSETLAWTGDPRGTTMHDRWEERRCRRAECASAPTCPVHRDDIAEIDGLALLFTAAVESQCSDDRFLARTIDVTYVDPGLDARGVSDDALARRLLTALGRRGYVFGFLSGGAGEGVHGWLDAAETGELAAALAALVPALVPAGVDDDDFPGQVLARILAVCRQAVAAGRGVAWINH